MADPGLQPVAATEPSPEGISQPVQDVYAAIRREVEPLVRDAPLPNEILAPDKDEIHGLDVNHDAANELPVVIMDPMAVREEVRMVPEPQLESVQAPAAQPAPLERPADLAEPDPPEEAPEPTRPVEVQRQPDVPPTKAGTNGAIARLAAAGVLTVAIPSTAILALGRLLMSLRRTAFFAGSPLITRIKGQKALEDPKRRLLFQLISARPGISMKELCDAAMMSRSAVEHHLAVVGRAKLIVAESYGHGRHFFSATKFTDRSRRLAHPHRGQVDGSSPKPR